MVAFSVAISAGGNSSRMGTDKAFVPLAGRPIMRHVMACIADVGQTETFIVTNRPEDYSLFGLPMFGDVIPDKGALGGVHAAVHHSKTDYALVVACDMPFLEPDLMRYMVRLADETGADVIAPTVDDYPQGLHALYRKTCLPHIEARLAADRLKVIGFYPQVTVRTIAETEYAPYIPGGHPFFNVNTPEQLAEAQQIAEKLME
ncbi:MAG: molybdenum cofactor guanylyltransferase [Chloroflexota bacterium]